MKAKPKWKETEILANFENFTETYNYMSSLLATSSRALERAHLSEVPKARVCRRAPPVTAPPPSF